MIIINTRPLDEDDDNDDDVITDVSRTVVGGSVTVLDASSAWQPNPVDAVGSREK